MIMELEAENHLHESLMDFIIKNLDCQSKTSLMCVSKEWNTICAQPEYWDTVHLAEAQVSLTANDLVKLLQRARGSVKVVDTSSTTAAWQAQQAQRFRLGVKLQECLPYTKGLRALALAALLPRLQHLVLDERASCIGGMTDDFACALARGSPLLEALEVHFERYSVPSEHFTDLGVVALAEGCRGLRSLTLHNCMSVTDRSLYALAAYCQQLEDLSLGGYSERISDFGLTILFEACGRLRSVRLCSKLYKVTDEATAVLARHCPGLEVVKLTQICSDASLRHLGGGCRKLRQVVLKLSRQVTAAGVVQLALQCPSLEQLVLPAAFQLAGSELAQLEAAGCGVETTVDSQRELTLVTLQRARCA